MKWYDILIVSLSVLLIFAICVTIAYVYNKNEKNERKKDRILFLNKVNIISGYLSIKENNFFKVLKEVSNNMGYYALPKVCVQNIISCNDEKLKNCNSFKSHLDFCLFTKLEFKPVLAIDLFDNTIGDQAISEMDKLLIKIIQNVNIPLLKIEYNSEMTAEVLKDLIEKELFINNNAMYKEEI